MHAFAGHEVLSGELLRRHPCVDPPIPLTGLFQVGVARRLKTVTSGKAAPRSAIGINTTVASVVLHCNLPWEKFLKYPLRAPVDSRQTVPKLSLDLFFTSSKFVYK
jgi:hypothetical protein